MAMLYLFGQGELQSRAHILVLSRIYTFYYLKLIYIGPYWTSSVAQYTEEEEGTVAHSNQSAFNTVLNPKSNTYYIAVCQSLDVMAVFVFSFSLSFL